MEIMGYRNITVTDEFYDELEAAKKEKESFNKLLDRLLPVTARAARLKAAT